MKDLFVLTADADAMATMRAVLNRPESLGIRHIQFEVQSTQPKELFEHICREKLRRTISPRDFEQIAQQASLKQWQNSAIFSTLVGLLQSWFPLR